MLNSAILEVVIGLIFIYWLLAMICSTVNEVIVGFIGLRTRELQQGIRGLLEGGVPSTGKPSTAGFVQDVLNHSLIRGLTKSTALSTKSWLQNYGPSYISARTFATAVFDTLFPADGKTPALIGQARTFIAQDAIPDGLKAMLRTSSDQALVAFRAEAQRLLSSTSVNPDMRNALTAILNTSNEAMSKEVKRFIDEATLSAEVRNVLSSYLNQTEAGLQQFRKDLEQWYDDCMERVSGWYKRRTQVIIAIIASIACAVFNIDTLAVANHLFRAPADRAAIIVLAESVVKEGETASEKPAPDQTKTSAERRLDDLLKLTNQAALAQIGWPNGFNLFQNGVGGFFLKLCGWALSIIAAMFGAPFWFDLLVKTLNMRNAGQKPKEAK